MRYIVTVDCDERLRDAVEQSLKAWADVALDLVEPDGSMTADELDEALDGATVSIASESGEVIA